MRLGNKGLYRMDYSQKRIEQKGGWAKRRLGRNLGIRRKGISQKGRETERG
jgi:hypothetical protein